MSAPGRVRRLLLTVAVVAAGPMLLARALAQDEAPIEWFTRVDRNGNGCLDRDEVPNPRFDELDLHAHPLLLAETHRLLLELLPVLPSHPTSPLPGWSPFYRFWVSTTPGEGYTERRAESRNARPTQEQPQPGA